MESPRNPCKMSFHCSNDRSGTAAVSIVSLPSASPVSVAVPSFAVTRYVLSASRRNAQTFVASPKHDGNLPVADGSRLPVCPAFLALSSRRTVCKARFDVIPAGLLSNNKPSTASYRLLLPRATVVTPLRRTSVRRRSGHSCAALRQHYR